jgi:ABC-2 type transport system permease protein
LPDSNKPLFEFRTHARYNPEAATAVGPGLVGVILTMTMPIFPRCL